MRGTQKWKCEPFPSVLSHQIVPLKSLTSHAHKDNPNPTPPCVRESVPSTFLYTKKEKSNKILINFCLKSDEFKPQYGISREFREMC